MFPKRGAETLAMRRGNLLDVGWVPELGVMVLYYNFRRA